MTAYYNEIDPLAAQWLRNLIAVGRLPAGHVDDRSIADVQPADLAGYVQCHFFAGIGGWPLALELAGWPADRPVWTGSCPCQPFSAAGKRKGAADERHLWPEWFRLIRQCRPSIVFGEQVEGAVRLGWLDGVFADLEGEGYACGAAVLGAHSVGAPHIRQRLFWVADSHEHGPLDVQQSTDRWGPEATSECRGDGGLADADGRNASDGELQRGRQHGQQPQDRGAGERMGDAIGAGLEIGRRERGDDEPQRAATERAGEDAGGLGDADGERRDGKPIRLQSWGPFQDRPETPWSSCILVPCADGKARRAGSGVRILAPRLSDCLAEMRAIETAATEAVKRHAETSQADPAEVLRAMRECIRSWPCRQDQAAGMRIELPAQEVLFAFLRRIESACESGSDTGGVAEKSGGSSGSQLRSLRRFARIVRPSRERQPDGQPPAEPSDPLLALSLVLACHAEAHRSAADDADAAANRVGKLRAGGNAIVPQIAAEFIRAFQEIGRVA